MNDWFNRGEQYGLQLNTAATTEPISTATAKTHLRVDTSDEDTYIDTLIAAARAQVENMTGRRLVTQTWTMYRDEFPVGDREIVIPYGPVQSISSIIYLDTGGISTTLSSANYLLDSYSIIPRVYPAFSLIWPATRLQRNAVAIRYVTGYGVAAAVPANITRAMLLLIAHWYESREDVVIGASVEKLPQGVEVLLGAERVSWL